MPIKKPVQYNVTELEGKNKLIVELNDYNSFSAEFPILEESSFIGKMYKVKSQKENNVNNYKLHIDLKKPVKYEVFELENPGRVVIDITEK